MYYTIRLSSSPIIKFQNGPVVPEWDYNKNWLIPHQYTFIRVVPIQVGINFTPNIHYLIFTCI